MMNYPSKLIENAVQEFKRLPGIGEKTALRLVLHLLKQNENTVTHFGDTIIEMRKQIKRCACCYNLSDYEICEICNNPSRNEKLICVVENIRDVIAIESTGIFTGLYHVLGGVISPVEGVGPDAIHIAPLLQRIQKNNVEELVMALSPTMEGDTTIFYISKQLEKHDIKITSIARGVAFGGELEYTDELTLARSITTRMPYENYLVNK